MTPADHQHEDPQAPAAESGDAWVDEPGPTLEAPEQPGKPEQGDRPGSADGGDRGVDEAAGDTPTELVADLAKAQEDVASLTGDLQRLQAEYLNYKRRVDRDRDLVRQTAQFSVLSSLLPVLDDIDRARDHGEVEGGFKAVADSLERIVTGLGLEKFGEPGDEFDPNLHEALVHAHSPDVTTTTCQTIVHAGYRIGDRVVRPARVTVVDPEPATGAPDQPSDGDE